MESKSKVGTRAQRTPIIMHLYCLKMLPFFICFFQFKKEMDGWMDGWVGGCVRACVRACVCVCVIYFPKATNVLVRQSLSPPPCISRK